jgi:Carboxypeptidase regulatory-like domain
MVGAAALAAWVLWPRAPVRVVEAPLPSPSARPAAVVAPDGGAPLRTVMGRVVDGSGRPIGGVRVEMVGDAPPRSAEPSGELGILRPPIPYPPAAPASLGPYAMSDADGRFRLEGVGLGPARVSASHPQFAPQTAAVGVGPLEIVLLPAPPAPSLEPGAVEIGNQRLAGTVVDDRGFPVGGARVEAAGRGALSDPGGRFALDGLPPGPWHVRATHLDFAPAEVTLGAGEEAQLQLVPGGGIEGELRDARGGVPAGAVVELSVDGRSQALALRGGRFVATGVRAGRVLLSARAPGCVPARLEVEVPPGDRPGDLTARDLRMVLERGGVVSGSVRGDDG